MSWDYGMGYGGGGYDADEYDEQEQQDQYEEQPPQRQRRDGQGLRAYAQRVQKENADLKEKLRAQEEALRDLVGQAPQSAGFAPQNTGPQGGYPHPRSEMITPEQQMQISRMQEMGVLGTAAPLGTEREQAVRIQNAKSPQELLDYLASQGNQHGTGNYQGMGY
ncbi:hypothetical protein [Streptomyces sp. 1222.5]|uniref:hypothetical protein n=1 Tax=Streptomyces sp. 1222.5 TaxID=1881026 RepID=UPI003D752395